MQTYPDIFESVTFSFRIQIFHVHSYLYSNQICPSTRIQHVSRYTLVRRTPLGTATATKTSRKKWIRTSSNFYLTYSDSFIVKCWQIFLELNFKRLYQSSGKEREGRCIVFTCLTQREIRHFHVVVVQRRQRNLQKLKSDARAKLLFEFVLLRTFISRIPTRSSSNVGKFFWSWILKRYIKVHEKKEKVVVLCSRAWHNVKLGTFSS